MELADFKNMKDTLYSAVIADILDEMGYRNQAMSHTLHPLQDHDVVVGRAFTVLAADVYDIPERPYYMEFKAVDSLQEGDVLVVSTNGSTCSGFWGELLTTAALRHGAVGAVIDGMSRAMEKVRAENVVRDELRAGVSAEEVWNKYHIL